MRVDMVTLESHVTLNWKYAIISKDYVTLVTSILAATTEEQSLSGAQLALILIST
jgi:hypothetical protein